MSSLLGNSWDVREYCPVAWYPETTTLVKILDGVREGFYELCCLGAIEWNVGGKMSCCSVC